MSFLGDFFTGNNDPPAPPSGPTEIVLSGEGPEMPEAPGFAGPSPEEAALMRFQLERMRRADGQAAAMVEGVAIAREIVTRLRSVVQGLQISTAGGNIDAALAVVDGLR